MSLDWSVEKVKNYKEVCWVDDGPDTVRVNPITEAIIWGLLEIDMGSITDKNWRDVWMRLTIMDAVREEGRIRYLDEESDKFVTRSITKEEVISHIGLSTNVSNKPSTAFYKKVKQIVERETKDLAA